MKRMVRGCLLIVLLASVARAGSYAEPPPITARHSLGAKFVVRAFEANGAAKKHAHPLTQVMIDRMNDATLNVAAQHPETPPGCGLDGACADALAIATNARFIVNGRIDHFDDRYLLSASVYDFQKSEVRIKSQREVTDPGLLIQAMNEVADELLAPFGVPPTVELKLADRVDALGFNLGLKLGTTLLTSLFRLAPVGEVELGFRISYAWLVFLQIGFGVAFDQTTQTSVGLTPGLLGVRYHFRSDKGFQPTVGGGLGVISTINAAQGKTRLSLILNLGVLYLITQHVSASMEVSMDVLGLAYGVADKTNALTGLNFGVSLGINYRF